MPPYVWPPGVPRPESREAQSRGCDCSSRFRAVLTVLSMTCPLHGPAAVVACERARIVAWLRGEADSVDPESASWSPYRAADAIERGGKE